MGNQDVKPGDWMCTSCGDHNFAKNSQCRRCGAPKPGADGGEGLMMGGAGSFGMTHEVKPGDWMCGNCGDHNFGRNVVCRKCGAAKPTEGRARSRSPLRVS